MNDEGESPPTASYGLALSDAATASTLLPGPPSAAAVMAPAAGRLSAATHPAPSRLSVAPAMLAVPGLSQALMPIIESPDRQGLPNVLPWELPQALDAQGSAKAGNSAGGSCVGAVTWHGGARLKPQAALIGAVAGAGMPAACWEALLHAPATAAVEPLSACQTATVLSPGCTRSSPRGQSLMPA